jgi:hypothetical protein
MAAPELTGHQAIKLSLYRAAIDIINGCYFRAQASFLRIISNQPTEYQQWDFTIDLQPALA